MLRKIFYNSKNTMANTTYYEISTEDNSFLMTKLIQMQSYFGEISLTKERDIKDLIKWYTSPNKSLPFNSNFKRHNSPQSFVSGVLNNTMFGTQRDITDVQATHLENIISIFSQFTDIVKADKNIRLHENQDNSTVLFVENIIEYK